MINFTEQSWFHLNWFKFKWKQLISNWNFLPRISLREIVMHDMPWCNSNKPLLLLLTHITKVGLLQPISGDVFDLAGSRFATSHMNGLILCRHKLEKQSPCPPYPSSNLCCRINFMFVWVEKLHYSIQVDSFQDKFISYRRFMIKKLIVFHPGATHGHVS